MKVVHIMEHDGDGFKTLCGQLRVDVPHDHDWVLNNNGEQERSNCAKCREAAGLRVMDTDYLAQIDCIYAFVSSDKNGEGVLAAPIGPGGSMLPLIGADMARIKDISVLARRISKTLGIKVKLVKFTTREVLEEIE